MVWPFKNIYKQGFTQGKCWQWYLWSWTEVDAAMDTIVTCEGRCLFRIKALCVYPFLPCLRISVSYILTDLNMIQTWHVRARKTSLTNSMLLLSMYNSELWRQDIKGDDRYSCIHICIQTSKTLVFNIVFVLHCILKYNDFISL